MCVESMRRGREAEGAEQRCGSDDAGVTTVRCGGISSTRAGRDLATGEENKECASVKGMSDSRRCEREWWIAERRSAHVQVERRGEAPPLWTRERGGRLGGSAGPAHNLRLRYLSS